jgi:hypothetical protein
MFFEWRALNDARFFFILVAFARLWLASSLSTLFAESE